MHLVIKFSENRSKYFKDVLVACKQFRYFAKDGDKYELNTTLLECIQNFEHLESIATMALKWTSFRYQIGENVVNQRHEFMGRVYYPLQAIMQCINNKEKSSELNYCNEGKGWGCMRLSDINLIPTFYSEHNWFDYGDRRDGKWVINKGKLEATIKREAELKLLHVCPYFDEHHIEQTIKNLPDEIDVATRNWEFKKQLIFDHSTKEFRTDVVGLRWIGDIENFSI